jgi:D-tyrosyl-tRNA(Tyr) deacylase
MTISVNSNAKASQKISSSHIASKHETRHGRGSKGVHTLGKAKNGWLGAALRRGHGGTGCSPPVERRH